MSDCIFCRIVAGETPASFVHRDELICAVLDVRPITPGNLLVIPNEYRFVDPGDLKHYFPKRIARRLVAGLAARDQGSPRYLVDGRNTDAS